MYRGSPLRSTLNTSYITGLGMCKYGGSPLRSTLNTSYTTGLGMCKYGGSPLRSTLITSYITGLGMSKVCTEAVHCAALWTPVTLPVWAWVSQTHMAKSRKRGPRVSKWTKSSSSYGDYHRMYARLHAIGAKNKHSSHGRHNSHSDTRFPFRAIHLIHLSQNFHLQLLSVQGFISLLSTVDRLVAEKENDKQSLV